MAKTTRAGEVGQLMARALIGMVHLMYQDTTALNFLYGLFSEIAVEFNRRKIAKIRKAGRSASEDKVNMHKHLIQVLLKEDK